MTVKQTIVATPATSDPPAVAPLRAGDRLTRDEFHRRYLLHPEIKKAELIDGVVYMPSPIRYRQHDRPQSHAVTWLGTYSAMTPGVRSGVSASLFLSPLDEVQSDALLFIDPVLGGQTRETADDYLEGAPELVVEIAASSASRDLNLKREAYLRAGVQEYLVVLTHVNRVQWLRREGDAFAEATPGEDGVYRSRTFPGLWLDPAALLAGDLAEVLAKVQAGVASPEHAAFVAELAARAG